jgi:uncharacterized protein YicC (UPF0701 family)
MPAKKTKKTPRVMSTAHKDALEVGRRQSRAVRGYLEALEAHKPKRGRKRTAAAVNARLTIIETTIGDADPLNRLLMMQEQRDLLAELESFDEEFDIGELEAEFVEHGAEYSATKGISYGVWRDMGITADVLRRAGITR